MNDPAVNPMVPGQTIHVPVVVCPDSTDWLAVGIVAGHGITGNYEPSWTPSGEFAPDGMLRVYLSTDGGATFTSWPPSIETNFAINGHLATETWGPYYGMPYSVGSGTTFTMEVGIRSTVPTQVNLVVRLVNDSLS